MEFRSIWIGVRSCCALIAGNPGGRFSADEWNWIEFAISSQISFLVSTMRPPSSFNGFIGADMFFPDIFRIMSHTCLLLTLCVRPDTNCCHDSARLLLKRFLQFRSSSLYCSTCGRVRRRFSLLLAVFLFWYAVLHSSSNQGTGGFFGSAEDFGTHTRAISRSFVEKAPMASSVSSISLVISCSHLSLKRSKFARLITQCWGRGSHPFFLDRCVNVVGKWSLP